MPVMIATMKKPRDMIMTMLMRKMSRSMVIIMMRKNRKIMKMGMRKQRIHMSTRIRMIPKIATAKAMMTTMSMDMMISMVTKRNRVRELIVRWRQKLALR